MARKPEPPPPGFIGMRHDYERALSEYVAEVMGLEQVARLILVELPNEKLRGILATRLNALEAAKYREKPDGKA